MRDRDRHELAEQLAAAALLRAELAALTAEHPTLRESPRATAEQGIAAAGQAGTAPLGGDA